LWTAIMDGREFFRAQVQWVLGDRSEVMAVGQPWFLEWEEHLTLDRGLTLIVADLTCLESAQWDVTRAVEIFRDTNTQCIINQVSPPKGMHGCPTG
jgi:TAP C-terminal domain